MIYILENILPILAATLVSFAFGAAWYILLSKPWMKAAGLTEDKLRGGPGPKWVPFVVAILAEFWIASILAGALILAPNEAGVWAMTFGTAFIIWVGFIFPALVVNDRFERKPWRLSFINGGHWLGVCLLQVVVMRVIGLAPPPGV